MVKGFCKLNVSKCKVEVFICNQSPSTASPAAMGSAELVQTGPFHSTEVFGLRAVPSFLLVCVSCDLSVENYCSALSEAECSRTGVDEPECSVGQKAGRGHGITTAGLGRLRPWEWATLS